MKLLSDTNIQDFLIYLPKLAEKYLGENYSYEGDTRDDYLIDDFYELALRFATSYMYTSTLPAMHPCVGYYFRIMSSSFRESSMRALGCTIPDSLLSLIVSTTIVKDAMRPSFMGIPLYFIETNCRSVDADYYALDDPGKPHFLPHYSKEYSSYSLFYSSEILNENMLISIRDFLSSTFKYLLPHKASYVDQHGTEMTGTILLWRSENGTVLAACVLSLVSSSMPLLHKCINMITSQDLGSLYFDSNLDHQYYSTMKESRRPELRPENFIRGRLGPLLHTMYNRQPFVPFLDVFDSTRILGQSGEMMVCKYFFESIFPDQIIHCYRETSRQAVHDIESIALRLGEAPNPSDMMPIDVIALVRGINGEEIITASVKTSSLRPSVSLFNDRFSGDSSPAMYRILYCLNGSYLYSLNNGAVRTVPPSSIEEKADRDKISLICPLGRQDKLRKMREDMEREGLRESVIAEILSRQDSLLVTEEFLREESDKIADIRSVSEKAISCSPEMLCDYAGSLTDYFQTCPNLHPRTTWSRECINQDHSYDSFSSARPTKVPHNPEFRSLTTTSILNTMLSTDDAKLRSLGKRLYTLMMHKGSEYNTFVKDNRGDLKIDGIRHQLHTELSSFNNVLHFTVSSPVQSLISHVYDMFRKPIGGSKLALDKGISDPFCFEYSRDAFETIMLQSRIRFSDVTGSIDALIAEDQRQAALNESQREIYSKIRIITSADPFITHLCNLMALICRMLLFKLSPGYKSLAYVKTCDSIYFITNYTGRKNPAEYVHDEREICWFRVQASSSGARAYSTQWCSRKDNLYGDLGPCLVSQPINVNTTVLAEQIKVILRCAAMYCQVTTDPMYSSPGITSNDWYVWQAAMLVPPCDPIEKVKEITDQSSMAHELFKNGKYPPTTPASLHYRRCIETSTATKASRGINTSSLSYPSVGPECDLPHFIVGNKHVGVTEELSETVSKLMSDNEKSKMQLMMKRMLWSIKNNDPSILGETFIGIGEHLLNQYKSRYHLFGIKNIVKITNFNKLYLYLKSLDLGDDSIMTLCGMTQEQLDIWKENGALHTSRPLFQYVSINGTESYYAPLLHGYLSFPGLIAPIVAGLSDGAVFPQRVVVQPICLFLSQNMRHSNDPSKNDFVKEYHSHPLDIVNPSSSMSHPNIPKKEHAIPAIYDDLSRHFMKRPSSKHELALMAVSSGYLVPDQDTHAYTVNTQFKKDDDVKARPISSGDIVGVECDNLCNIYVLDTNTELLSKKSMMTSAIQSNLDEICRQANLPSTYLIDDRSKAPISRAQRNLPQRMLSAILRRLASRHKTYCPDLGVYPWTVRTVDIDLLVRYRRTLPGGAMNIPSTVKVIVLPSECDIVETELDYSSFMPGTSASTIVNTVQVHSGRNQLPDDVRQGQIMSLANQVFYSQMMHPTLKEGMAVSIFKDLKRNYKLGIRKGMENYHNHLCSINYGSMFLYDLLVSYMSRFTHKKNHYSKERFDELASLLQYHNFPDYKKMKRFLSGADSRYPGLIFSCQPPEGNLNGPTSILIIESQRVSSENLLSSACSRHNGLLSHNGQAYEFLGDKVDLAQMTLMQAGDDVLKIFVGPVDLSSDGIATYASHAASLQFNTTKTIKNSKKGYIVGIGTHFKQNDDGEYVGCLLESNARKTGPPVSNALAFSSISTSCTGGMVPSLMLSRLISVYANINMPQHGSYRIPDTTQYTMLPINSTSLFSSTASECSLAYEWISKGLSIKSSLELFHVGLMRIINLETTCIDAANGGIKVAGALPCVDRTGLKMSQQRSMSTRSNSQFIRDSTIGRIGTDYCPGLFSVGFKSGKNSTNKVPMNQRKVLASYNVSVPFSGIPELSVSNFTLSLVNMDKTRYLIAAGLVVVSHLNSIIFYPCKQTHIRSLVYTLNGIAKSVAADASLNNVHSNVFRDTFRKYIPDERSTLSTIMGAENAMKFQLMVTALLPRQAPNPLMFHVVAKVTDRSQEEIIREISAMRKVMGTGTQVRCSVNCRMPSDLNAMLTVYKSCSILHRAEPQTDYESSDKISFLLRSFPDIESLFGLQSYYPAKAGVCHNDTNVLYRLNRALAAKSMSENDLICMASALGNNKKNMELALLCSIGVTSPKRTHELLRYSKYLTLEIQISCSFILERSSVRRDVKDSARNLIEKGRLDRMSRRYAPMEYARGGYWDPPDRELAFFSSCWSTQGISWCLEILGDNFKTGMGMICSNATYRTLVAVIPIYRGDELFFYCFLDCTKYYTWITDSSLPARAIISKEGPPNSVLVTSCEDIVNVFGKELDNYRTSPFSTWSQYSCINLFTDSKMPESKGQRVIVCVDSLVSAARDGISPHLWYTTQKEIREHAAVYLRSLPDSRLPCARSYLESKIMLNRPSTYVILEESDSLYTTQANAEMSNRPWHELAMEENCMLLVPNYNQVSSYHKLRFRQTDSSDGTAGIDDVE